jgi:predicted RNA-binding protein with PUA-like domain
VARNYWLVKSEPGAYSWSDMLRDGETEWDGVRNYEARNNLKAMRSGDRLLWYHSVGDKEVVGVAEVTREHYPDPSADPGDDRWVVVDVVPVADLQRPVTLAQVKAHKKLGEIALVRKSRLSVAPLRAVEYDLIVDELGGGTCPAGSRPAPAPPAKKKTAKKKTAKKKTAKKKTAKKKTAKKKTTKKKTAKKKAAKKKR